jgi:hypothetical protein
MRTSPEGPVRPRRLGFAGRVSARGLVLDPARVGVGEARRRVLDAMGDDARCVSLGPRIAVLWRAPRIVDVADAPGGVLVDERGVALAAPLDARERAALGHLAEGTIVMVEDGELTVVPPGTQRDVELEAWLAPSALDLEPTTSLGVPPPPPPPIAQAPRRSPNEVLLGTARTAADDKAQAEVRAALARIAGRGEGDGRADPARSAALEARVRGGGAAGRGSADGLGGGLRRWLAERVAGLVAWWGGASGSGASGSGGSGAPGARRAGAGRALGARAGAGGSVGARAAANDGGAEDPSPRRPGLLARLDAWARSVLFERLIGAHNARYLRQMLEKLEAGATEEALRWAIPLEGDQPTQGRPAAPGRLAPRPDLRPAPSGGPTQALAASTQLFEHLRSVYQQTFQRLERAGRHAEAAYVLGELLGRPLDAVAYLERHGLLREAAELAEARALSPQVRIRQWLRAGELAHALRIIEATGTFAEGVALVARTHPAEADTLRVAWAERLASRGDYAGAVDASWPVEAARALAARWMDLGIEAGGSGVWGLVARRASLDEAGARALLPRVEALAADPQAAADRAALAAALGEMNAATLAPLVRAISRPLLVDRATRGGTAGSRRALDQLVARGGDRLLESDLPADPPPRARPRPSGLVELVAGAAGQLPVLDACWLAGGLAPGRVALALGEVGVRVKTAPRGVEPGGERAYPALAHALVPSTLGDRVLALGRRGRTWVLTRIDVVHGRADALGSLELDGWAPSFDGGSWFTWKGRTLSELRVDGERVERGFTVELDAPPVLASASAARLVVVTAPEAPSSVPNPWDPRAEPLSAGSDAAAPRGEVWRWERPALTLRARDAYVGERPLAVGDDGRARVWDKRYRAEVQPYGPLGGVPACFAVGEGLLAAWTLEGGDGSITLAGVQPTARESRCVLRGLRPKALRFAGDVLVAFDDEGRVLVVRGGGEQLWVTRVG